MPTRVTSKQLETLVLNGWSSYDAVIPTRTAADDPTYTIQFAGVDLTGILAEGMKISWIQNSIRRYGFINKAPSFSTNTTVSVLTRLDSGSGNYDVLDTSTNAISGFRFSTDKAPLGFPMDPIIWTVAFGTAGLTTMNTPTVNTWITTGLSINVPIGSFRIFYKTSLQTNMGVTTGTGITKITLSSDAATETDNETSLSHELASASGTLALATPVMAEKQFILTTKATYTLMVRTNSSSVSAILIRGDFATTIMRAICSYL